MYLTSIADRLHLIAPVCTEIAPGCTDIAPNT